MANFMGGTVEAYAEATCTACGKVAGEWVWTNWGWVQDEVWNPGEYVEATFSNRSLASDYARERAREIVAYRASVCCSNKRKD